jgi:hypothetical protein
MTDQFTEITVGQSKEMPAKTIVYGVPKVGKSSFAAQYPNTFFINIEDGLDYLPTKVRATPQLKAFDDVLGWIKHIYESKDFKADYLVFDSLDWAETLAQGKISGQHNNIPVSDVSYKPFGYSKGYEMAAQETIKLFRWADAIYKAKGIKSVFICHSQVKNVDLPAKDPYSRHELKLYKTLSAKAFEWADLVLFADYSFHVTKDGKTSEPKPALFAGGSASFLGGGRMSLSKEIPLSYKALENEITKGIK